MSTIYISEPKAQGDLQPQLYLHAEVMFEDKQRKFYDIKYFPNYHAHYFFVFGRLIDRFKKFGRDGNPGKDLRQFNGNHASGRGRKLIRPVKYRTWIGPIGSRPTGNDLIWNLVK